MTKRTRGRKVSGIVRSNGKQNASSAEPALLEYSRLTSPLRRVMLQEDEAGFRLLFPSEPMWLTLIAPISWIILGIMWLTTAGTLCRIVYGWQLPSLEPWWAAMIAIYIALGSTGMIASIIVLIREVRRPRHPGQVGVERGRLFRIRDGTWRTRRKDVIVSDVRDVRLKELRSVFPSRKEIEIAIHFRGRWQFAWRKRFGGKNMALGRRFYELLVEAVEVQNKAGPPP